MGEKIENSEEYLNGFDAAVEKIQDYLSKFIVYRCDAEYVRPFEEFQDELQEFLDNL